MDPSEEHPSRSLSGAAQPGAWSSDTPAQPGQDWPLADTVFTLRPAAATTPVAFKICHRYTVELTKYFCGSGLSVSNGLETHIETLLGGNFKIKHLGNVRHPELTILSGYMYAMFCRLIRTSVATGHKNICCLLPL